MWVTAKSLFDYQPRKFFFKQQKRRSVEQYKNLRAEFSAHTNYIMLCYVIFYKVYKYSLKKKKNGNNFF